ncbi:co-chaperone GroES [Candidatus Absconditicoccus praedator]|uniref:co-chaperone GroES n=1 Tax=Candidatus Absconditicoccus praedator TaxID=2735562 RepID=UPI001E2BC14E|nr:co-chaperone GroES [Candidatus Absconditicoccus praedator]UFX83372.1 co-chaperone GroES [Candidatus Absconditicoccus praedator]
MTKLVPIEDRIVVKTIKEESKTKGGIVLPETTKEKPGRGEVVAVGEGKILDDGKRAPMDIKVGDVVHFTKFSPDEIELEENGEKVKYLVVKHDQVLAKENS